MKINVANIPFFIGVMYIAFVTILAFNAVGTIPEKLQPAPWHLPVTVFAMILIPFVLGLIAGSDRRQ